MNQSLINVLNNTSSVKVLQVAKFLLDNRRRRVAVMFAKKDGTLRRMVFVPDHEYNETFGIPTTNIGRRIVASKCSADMITVQEITEIGTSVQPRTVNLRTVVKYELA